MKKRIGVFAALLLLCVGTIPADEGRKEIFAPVVLTGTSLSGNYFLSRDVTALAGTIAIDVVGSGTETVEINLNGFTVRGGMSSLAVIRVFNVKSFTLRNGSVIALNSLGDGVHITGIPTGTSALEDQVVLEDIKLTGGDEAIELLDVNNFLIQRLLVVNVSGSGIDIDLTTPSVSNTLSGRVVQNSIRKCDIGINIAADNEAVEIRNNTILSSLPDSAGVIVFDSSGLIVSENNIKVTGGTPFSGAHGIGLSKPVGCIVDGNTIQGADNGISLDSAHRCSISNNVAGSNSGHGVLLWGVAGGGSDFNRIRENSFSNNGKTGIELQDDSDANFIAANDTNSNGDFGIHFGSASDGNRYGLNSATLNSGGVACTNFLTCGIPPDFCDDGGAVSDNLSFGGNLIPGNPLVFPPTC